MFVNTLKSVKCCANFFKTLHCSYISFLEKNYMRSREIIWDEDNYIKSIRQSFPTVFTQFLVPKFAHFAVIVCVVFVNRDRTSEVFL